jgi:hypothetical protein
VLSKVDTLAVFIPPFGPAPDDPDIYLSVTLRLVTRTPSSIVAREFSRTEGRSLGTHGFSALLLGNFVGFAESEVLLTGGLGGLVGQEIAGDERVPAGGGVGEAEDQGQVQRVRSGGQRFVENPVTADALDADAVALQVPVEVVPAVSDIGRAWAPERLGLRSAHLAASWAGVPERLTRPRSAGSPPAACPPRWGALVYSRVVSSEAWPISSATVTRSTPPRELVGSGLPTMLNACG